MFKEKEEESYKKPKTEEKNWSENSVSLYIQSTNKFWLYCEIVFMFL